MSSLLRWNEVLRYVAFTRIYGVGRTSRLAL
jgi:hypothetical protein